MKNLIIFLFVSHCCLEINAQNADTLNGRNRKVEKKLAFIEYKYISGEYEEAIQSSKALVSRLGKRPGRWTAYLVQAKIDQAYAYYASFHFDSASSVYKKALELSDQDSKEESKFLCFLKLSEYMAETGDLVAAFQNFRKAESLLKSGSTLKEKSDLSFLKVKILIKEGFINQPLKLIEEQLRYRLEMASSLTTSAENSMSIDKKIDFALRKEKYADLIHQKILALITNGSYKEADSLIANNKIWIKINLGQGHFLYREMLERLAEISMLKRDYGKASSLYANAYFATPFPEYEQNKIRNLSQLIIASYYSGQTVTVKNYLRRLGMYAFRKVGFIDPFRLAYEYTESYLSFIEGDFTSANSRLNRFKTNFILLPPSHLANIGLEELKAAIALKSGDIKMYKQSLSELAEIKRGYFGNDAPSFHKAQLALALFEIHYGKDFAGAEKILKTSYAALVKKEIIKDSKENMLYLTAYAELFGKTDRYDSAVVMARQAMEISKNLYEEKSPEYLLEFSIYIEYQILSGTYKEGFVNLQKAFDLSATIKGGDQSLLQNAYMIMANLYSLKGEFDRSRDLLNQAYKLTREGYEKQVLAEAEASEQMASLYLQTGNYFRAEKALLKSLSVKEDKLEKNSPLLIHTYQELARLNFVNGNYTLCEQYLKRAAEISAEIFGKQSLVFAECHLIYSEYYLSIGDFKKAETACRDADAIEVKILGKENLKRAETLSRLAFIRSKMPAYKSEEVDDLYKQATALIQKSLGSDNPLYVNLIQKQAEFYISTGKTDQADLLLTQAEKFWTSKLGSDNRYVAEIILLRGDIAYAKNKFDQAEKNYNKAKNLYASIFNENHPWYIQSSGKLARAYYMEKHPQKALDIMEEIIPKYLDYIVKYFPSLSFKEKKKFWNSIKEEFDFYNFIAVCIYQKDKPKLSAAVYDNIISTKALLLSSDLKVRRSIISSNDSILIGFYTEWVAQKEYLTNILSLTKQQLTEQNIDTRFIESRIEDLEKEMNKRSELFNMEEKKQNLSWKTIKETLKENEYAVEILRCRYFNKIFTDSVIYAGLIINNKTSDYPEVAIFPDGKSMEKKYFKYFRNVTIQKISDDYSYDVYWKPIKSSIPNGATIYLSSDGVYNQLNVEMMKNSTGEYVIDQNQIVAVTNTKDLLLRSTPGKKKTAKEVRKEVPANYVLCGNPDFYSGEVAIDHKTLASLPGAEKELLDLNNLLTSSGKTTLKFLSKDITEDTLRYLKNPKVFHIATHGFFKETANAGEDDLISDPLLNSGLVLYGGGDIVSNPENSYVNSKQGVLTAYEATNLHFDNTELVVLSACETGRGEVQVGEGVYGLQRSFLISGADAVIMSLFKVNDEVTQKLMMSFYDKWLKTGDKRKSFLDAKREIKKEYNFPIYWGVFIMIEGKPQDSVIAQQ